MSGGEDFVLGDGSRIAVIGGGPSGAFTAIFALKMARMIAKDISVAIFEPKDFNRHGPVGCNHCGRYLFSVTGIYKSFSPLTRAMLAVVRHEQRSAPNRRHFSNIFWNMFTGNERYKNIFGSAINLPLHLDIWGELARIGLRRESC